MHNQKGRSAREDIQRTLATRVFVKESHPLFWHGRLFQGGSSVPLVSPRVSWKSRCKPRDDHDSPSWLTASEYLDDDAVMEEKTNRLVELLRLSKRTVIYSGAGISVAAGICQVSRGEAGRRGDVTTAAVPTFTHYALGALARRGLVHGWVQQNHDGLRQKAGFPQEGVNEVHGSWYDPSNPVVCYDGELRARECEWMEREANAADLSLVMGTTLGGMHADQVAIRPALRSLTTTRRRENDQRSEDDDTALGTVIINPQQTEHDGMASLRIFGKSDDVLLALLGKFGMPKPSMEPKKFNFSEQMFVVPYDENGKRSSAVKMLLDLTPGAAVRVVGHNIPGAKQPSQRHIGKDTRGEVIRWNETTMAVIEVKRDPMLLGFWWLDAAMEGRVSTIPVVNVNPKIYVVKATCGPVRITLRHGTATKVATLDHSSMGFLAMTNIFRQKFPKFSLKAGHKFHITRAGTAKVNVLVDDGQGEEVLLRGREMVTCLQI